MAGLVLAVGVFAFWQSRAEPKASRETFSNEPAQLFKQPKNVPLSKGARQTVVKFIETAVMRKNLDQAWPIAGPAIKQGTTYKEWVAGNIAVVPYPAASVRKAPMKIDWSYPNEAALSVVLLPRKGANDKPQVFHAGLKKVGSKWVVEYWSPYAPPAIPENPAQG